MLNSLHRVLLPIVIVAGSASARAAPPVDFQRNVQPIFAEHCAECHGVDEAKRNAIRSLSRAHTARPGICAGRISRPQFGLLYIPQVSPRITIHTGPHGSG